MSGTTHRRQHTITVDAPADTVYGIIADAADWPRVFPPSVHVEQTPLGDGEETLHVWALANGEVRNWTSRRVLRPAELSVAFRQERTAHPATTMGGEWRVRPLPGGGCEVALHHDFTVVDDASEHVDWVDRAMDRNSNAELERMKATAEQAGQLSDLLHTFEDETEIAGSAADVYEFVWRAEEWERRLPHVARVKLTEPDEALQTLEMDTVAKDGSLHTTESVRVGFAPDRIVYKQLRLPPLLTSHVGEWTFRESPGGVTAVSRHTVVIEPSAVHLLGESATVADARAFVRSALGTNSLATLGHAREFAEERRVA